MITLILAHDEAGGIGLNNTLPWPHISEDLKRFRAATLLKTIIMGRKTFESLGKPLLKRENIVISRRGIDCDGEFTVTDQLDECLRWYKNRETFVIGGARIYEQALPYATRVLLTRVMGTYRADTFWKPDLTGWELKSAEDYIEHGQIVCVFEDWQRDKPAIH